MFKRITLVISCFLLLCLGMISAGFYFDEKKYENKIYPGIYVDNIYVGGLEKEQAVIKLKSYCEENLNQPITLTFEDKKWLLNPSQVIRIDVDETIAKSFKYQRTNSLIKNFFTRRRLQKVSKHLDITFKYEQKSEIVEDIKKAVYKEPQDAYFKVTGDTISIIEDVKGYILDEHSLKEQIINSIIWNKDKIVKVPVKQLNAENCVDDLIALGIKVKAAQFSTKFNKNLKERTENIRLAAKKLSGYILAPSEIFSFNAVVGERTQDKGYREAPIFVKNQTVPGVGGGVCQLSSTIYNLALLTDLEIVERSNHSLPVSYVPLGRDATVNYDQIDLKFRNNTDTHLFIHADVKGDTLNVIFFARDVIEKGIKLHSEKIKTISPPTIIKKEYGMEKGKTITKQGSPGYQVKLWKIYQIDGKEQKKVVSVDTYSPVPTIVYVGEKDSVEKSNQKENISDEPVDNNSINTEVY